MSIRILQCFLLVKKDKQKKKKAEKQAQSSQKISKFLGMTLERKDKGELFVPKWISRVFQTLSEVDANCYKAGVSKLRPMRRICTAICFYK